MQRIPSGVSDQYIYFFAADATDYVTPEPGFGSSGWTVVRSRNGAADVTYTTPTVAEIDSTTMPGVYALLVDEDTTIDSGDHSQNALIFITHTGMAPAKVPVEFYRPDVTAGQTITVSGGIPVANVTQFGGTNGTFSAGRPEVNTTHAAGTAWASGAITAAVFASDAITAAKVASDVGTEIATAVWANGTRTLTSNPGLDAAGIRTAVGLASANLDTQLSGINTNIDANEAKIDILDTNLDSLIADIGSNGAGLTTIPWNSAWDAEVQSEVEDGLTAFGAATASAVAIVDGNVDTIVATTNKLDDTLEDAGGGNWIFTEAALANAPSGGGGGLTAADVWTYGTRTLTSLGDGSGFTAIPWNASWDAEVQSEVTDALNAYDPPTNAELEARTLLAASYATSSALAALAIVVDAIDAKTTNLPVDPASESTIMAKLDELEAILEAPVEVDIARVNGIEVVGSGTELDPWGPI